MFNPNVVCKSCTNTGLAFDTGLTCVCDHGRRLEIIALLDSSEHALVDCHVHSKSSDGTQTEYKLREEADTKGLAHLWITDHEVVRNQEIAKRIVTGEGKCRVHLGIECTDASDSELHILGYFHDCTWTDEDEYKRRIMDTGLFDKAKASRESRPARDKLMITLLNLLLHRFETRDSQNLTTGGVKREAHYDEKTSYFADEKYFNVWKTAWESTLDTTTCRLFRIVTGENKWEDVPICTSFRPVFEYDKLRESMLQGGDVDFGSVQRPHYQTFLQNRYGLRLGACMKNRQTAQPTDPLWMEYFDNDLKKPRIMSTGILAENKITVEALCPSAEGIVSLLRKSGAVVVLAHPTTSKMWVDSKSDMTVFRGRLTKLITAGLDGIEVKSPEILDDVNLASLTGLNVYTRGSDYHGANKPYSQMGSFVKHVKRIAETKESSVSQVSESAAKTGGVVRYRYPQDSSERERKKKRRVTFLSTEGSQESFYS